MPPRTRSIGAACLATALLGSFSSIVAAAPLRDADADAMFRYPDLGSNEIVFVYAGDLWTVPAEGGIARPLASPPGDEYRPRFSPDGSEIAFVGNYEGDRDLYVIPATGGAARRVTWHPTNEAFSDWMPDGDRLIYSSGDFTGQGRAPKLMHVDADGGLPQAFPVPYGLNGTVSADGTWLAYTPTSRDTRTWKRYRGGLQTDIWLFNLETGESRRVTDWEGTDSFPMWHGSKLYFVSDRSEEQDHRLNIFEYDIETERTRQVTFIADADVKWPSIGPEDADAAIVFQYGSSIWSLDVEGNASFRVPITIPGERGALREQEVDASEFMQAWDISATGRRAVAQARGDIWTLPAKNGTPRNLTGTDDVAERDPSWSPDGRWIAYFSDETGEYELYVTQSDGKGDTHQLTDDGGPFKYSPTWSPDSKKLVFRDKTGTMFLVDITDGPDDASVEQFDRDPWANPQRVMWSHDSAWLTYARTEDEAARSSIFLYDVAAGERHRVTSPMFDDSSPTFDRKGDWLYFTSSRNFAPEYSALDTTWIYTDAGVLLAVPLREDVKQPKLPESDEEEWKDEKDADDEDAKDDEDSDDGDDADDDDDAEDADDTGDELAGGWECTADIPQMGPIDFTLTFSKNDDGTWSVSMSSPMFAGSGTATWNAGDGTFVANIEIDGGTVTLEGKLEDGMISGTGTGPDGMAVPFSGMPVDDGDDDDADGDDGDDDESSDEEAEAIKIDLEDMEARAIMIRVAPGRFSSLAVNDKNHLLYARGGAGIRALDFAGGKTDEQTVTAGGGFALSGDGKKMLVGRGSGAIIRNAASGGSEDRVVTNPMLKRIDPRSEWRQLVTDAWRIQRDFFYDANMHGVDWEAELDVALEMVDDASSRADVSYIIGEMIGELNVGHAYYWGGDLPDEPSMNVGLLGVDWEIGEDGDDRAFRIARILEGAEWDVDARNPLRAQGIDVEEGDYVLAVNGRELDVDDSPWRPFRGLAGRDITLTVSKTPRMDDESTREVVVKALGSESALRYRAMIEANRRMVEEATDGRVGYIYVPNTGVDGQTDLVRQFYGQAHKDALIIDERWNGGGQIPTRFIELLNRPVTNYWARRDGRDWMWPPDSHQGPMCMLINGAAGSGGDMFPWLFKRNGLGPLIGMRTWGGLVGISGNPTLIDGGYTAVPTFGFYETDGTWGIEGHGVDPDIEVIDDPALMTDGGDPQLERAIAEMLKAIKRDGFERPQRPRSPDRSGMGIPVRDR